MGALSDDDITELLELCDGLSTEKKKQVVSKFMKTHSQSPSEEAGQREAKGMIDEFMARRVTPQSHNLEYLHDPRSSGQITPVGEVDPYEASQRASMRKIPKVAVVAPAPQPEQPRMDPRKLLKMRALAAGEIPLRG